jgi:hypothetical protein
VIPRAIEAIERDFLRGCESVSSVFIESDSALREIEPKAFSISSLVSIVIPRSVEVLGRCCFSFCIHLSKVSFKPGSMLQGIEAEAFLCSPISSAVLPSRIRFIVADAFESHCRLWLFDANSCPAFEELNSACASGARVAFEQPIGRPAPRPASKWVVDLSSFEIVRRPNSDSDFSVELCEHRLAKFAIVVKTFPVSDSSKKKNSPVRLMPWFV